MATVQSIGSSMNNNFIAVVAGLLSHNLFFIHGEHHLRAPLYVQLGCLFSVGLFAARLNDGLQESITEVVATVGFYLLALFTSMVIYRVFFHSLRSFPGPPMYKITKLWHVMKVAPAQKNHLVLDELHRQYGDFVRTGPSELTVFYPGVFEAIGGAKTPCIKAPWYDMLHPIVALGSIRDMKDYAPRRKLWDTALSKKAARGEAPIIIRALDKLSNALQDLQGKPVDVTEWISYFAFDNMGELAFNKSFGMLDKHEWTGSVKTLRHGLGIFGYVTPAPWLAHVAFAFLPKSKLMWNGLLNFVKEVMGERLYKDSAKKDTSSWMIEAQRESIGDLNMNDLYGDAFSMIIAGSHSLATIVIFALRACVKHPEMQTKIREEISSLTDWADTDGLAGLEYFNAFINEIMRLYPTTPTGGTRLAYEHAVVIGETYIPVGTTIVAPRWSLSRLESCFERANEIVPERWTSRPEMIRDKRPYNPFNNGRHSCPGKNLGLMEIRLCLAMLVSRFEISFAPHEDGTAVTEKMTDTFTANPGPLQLSLTPRA